MNTATVEGEYTFLAGLLCDPRRVDVVADVLTAQDFSEPYFGFMFDSIVAEYSAGRTPSPVTLRPILQGHPGFEEMGGLSTLAKMTGEASALVARPKETALWLAERARKRRLVEGLDTAANLASDEAATLEQIIDAADASLSEATQARKGSEIMSGVGAMDRLMRRMEEDQTGVSCRVIKPLDNLVGTMRRKQLILMAGRPGMGKTAVALSYALGAAQNGHGVLFVSLEMSSEELAARAAADLSFDTSPVPYAAINDGVRSPQVFDAIADARERMADMPLTIIDTGSLTVGRLNMIVRRIARQMAAKGDKLELVVVDYLQLLRTDERHRSAYESVSEISRTLKSIAKDNDVAVLALAQLSREVEKRSDRRPQLADLRDSGQLEQDADTIVFLLREEYYVRKEKAEGWEGALAAVEGQIEFICAKRRNGPEGSATGQFHAKYQAVRA